MTTQYAEEQGFKKKYLAPLIVLMLCAVSLTGAAYAYSTSVTGHGDIDGDYISIDMYKANDDGSSYTVLTENLTSKHFQVYTERTVASTVTYNAYVEAGKLIYTTYVKVSTNLGNTSDFQLDGTGAYKAAAGAGKLAIKDVSTTGADATIDDLKTFMTVTSADGKTAIDKDADGTFHIKGETVYKVVFTFEIGAATASADNLFGTFNSVEDLQKAVNAFDADGVGFTFALKANYIEPTE